MATFTLSTLDRGAPRTYIRYALTFSCNADQRAAATEKLQKATKRLISEIPMLAGVVTMNEQKNTTVAVTLQQVNDFEATITTQLENDHQNYSAIRRQGIPPRCVSGIDFTPLSNDCIENTNPSCAIQATFIDGGLILVIYLHHAIADIRGVATILRLMSEGLPPRELDDEALELEASTVSEARARLSTGSGAPSFLAWARDVEQREQQSRQQDSPRGDGSPTAVGANSPGRDAHPNCAAILRFRLNILTQTAEMINSRRSLRNPNNTDMITPREVLIAVLWRAYARARWPNGAGDGVRTSVSFPVDLRGHLVPPLEPHWMGNAEMTVTANEDLLLLGSYYDLSTIERTASIVHASATSAASDLLARARIELMNAKDSPPELPQAQLIVHDWTAVPRMADQEMDLGLDLGRPDVIRRTGRSFGGNEVLLLPENAQADVWEVQIELQFGWMSGLMRDELLRGFLWGVAQ